MTKLKVIFYIAPLFFICSLVNAQDYRCSREKVIDYYELDKQEFSGISKNLKRYPGYFYARIPQIFFDSGDISVSQKDIFDRENIYSLGFERVDEAVGFSAGVNRNTLFYSFSNRAAKLTRWNLLRDESKLCIPRQLINYTSSDDFVGTIRLNHLESSTACFWKAVVVNEKTFMQSEFVMATSCEKGRPKLSFKVFVKEFQSVLRK